MEGSAASPIIRIFHVHKRYGSKTALRDISLDIYKNEFLFLSGPSGAGKSTLLKLIYLGEPVSEGQILVDGMNLSRIPRRRIPLLRRNIGIIFQNFRLIPTRTVFDNIALVLEAQGVKAPGIRKRVRNVLRTIGMESQPDSFPPSLSGGEQQRVAVGRALVGNPKIILADEPTGSLDPESAELILKLLQEFHRRGGTVLVATHDREMIRKIGGRVIHLKQGEVLDF